MCSNQRPVKKPATKTHPHQNRQHRVSSGPCVTEELLSTLWAVEGFAMHPMLPPDSTHGQQIMQSWTGASQCGEQQSMSGARAWETCPGNSAGPSAQTVQDSMDLRKCCIHLSGTPCLGKSWWEIHGDFTVQDLFTRTHHSHGQELPRTHSRWFPTLGTPDPNLSRLWTLCFSALGFSLFISTPLLCSILSFFVELADSASPRSSLEPALKAHKGRRFQSSSSVLSPKRESELGVQKRESEMNPRSIFSLALQPLTKLCQKVMGCFLQGA